MANDFDIAREQYENYRYCYDNGHSDWLPHAARCFDFWNGKQWKQADKLKLAAERRPALTFNIVESLIRTLGGMQRVLRNDVRFLPFSGATPDDARVRDALWLHTQQNNMFEFLESDIYVKGLIFGRAYYDVRMDYEEGPVGIVRIRQRRSQDILLDPSAEDYDPENWPQVLSRRWVSTQDIERMYGKDIANDVKAAPVPAFYEYDDLLMSQQMGALPHYTHTNVSDDSRVRARLHLERQYFDFITKDVFIDLETGDTSEIPETWDRNRIAKVLELTPGLGTTRKRVRTVRWQTTCDGVVCHKADSPYKNFTIVPYFPSFIDGVTQGAVSSLLDPQEMYNKLTSQELHIINTTANSGWKLKENSLKNMTVEQLEEIGSKPGLVTVLANTEDLQKIEPNTLPAGHDRLSSKADSIMRSIIGVSNQARGFAREDVAGEAILVNQAAQEVNAAGWMANLHRSKQILASRVMDCVQAHYTETRVIQINRGTPLSPEIQEMTINEVTAEGRVLNDVTSGKFTTVLAPAPIRTTLSESDFKAVLELKKLGVYIPDALLIELSPATNKAQIINSLREDSNEAAKAKAEAEMAAANAENEKTLAVAEKERSAAQLNLKRAEKFGVEAASDPDAAYERIELERLRIEEERNAAEAAFKARDLQLTEMKIRLDAAAKMKAASNPKPKPTGKKPGA